MTDFPTLTAAHTRAERARAWAAYAVGGWAIVAGWVGIFVVLA